MSNAHFFPKNPPLGPGVNVNLPQAHYQASIGKEVLGEAWTLRDLVRMVIERESHNGQKYDIEFMDFEVLHAEGEEGECEETGAYIHPCRYAQHTNLGLIWLPLHHIAEHPRLGPLSAEEEELFRGGGYADYETAALGLSQTISTPD